MGQERWKAIRAMSEYALIERLVSFKWSKTEHKLLMAEWQRRENILYAHTAKFLKARRDDRDFLEFKDAKGRWIAPDYEKCPHCDQYKSTMGDLMRQYRHCTSPDHIARKYGVDPYLFDKYIKSHKG